MKTYDLEGNLIEVEAEPIINSLERTPILDKFPEDLVGIAVAIPAKDGKPRMAFLPLNLFATRDQIDTTQRSLLTMGETVGRSISGKADKDEIPDVSGLASKEQVDQVDSKIPDVSNLASKDDVNSVDRKIDGAVNKADNAAEVADSAHQAAMTASEKSDQAALTANQAGQAATNANQQVQNNNQKVADLNQKSVDTSKVAAEASKMATDAMDAVSTRARKFDLGSIVLTEKPTIAVGAGITTLVVDCKDALVGDAFSIVPTALLPTGYMLGVATCVVAGKIQISVFHPALVVNGGYTITCKVFAYR